MTAAGTMGTLTIPVSYPRSCSAIQSMTPSAAARPNAEPPVRRIASTRGTRWRGSSTPNSRLPVAIPRTSTAARNGPSNTVEPLCPP